MQITPPTILVACCCPGVGPIRQNYLQVKGTILSPLLIKYFPNTSIETILSYCFYVKA